MPTRLATFSRVNPSALSLPSVYLTLAGLCWLEFGCMARVYARCIAFLAACQAEPEETETIVEEGEIVEVTWIVEVPVTVIAEAP